MALTTYDSPERSLNSPPHTLLHPADNPWIFFIFFQTFDEILVLILSHIVETLYATNKKAGVHKDDYLTALQQVIFSCSQSNSSQTCVREPTSICTHIPVSADWGFRHSRSWLKHLGPLGWLVLTFRRKLYSTPSGKPIYLPWNSIFLKLSSFTVCVQSFLSCSFHWNSSRHILRFSLISLLKNCGILSSFTFQTFHIHFIRLFINYFTQHLFQILSFSASYPTSLSRFVLQNNIQFL